ncbi:hypothetical protein OOK13_01580 [Streptomyces sp. NBC_00378]|uniref:hypothetical protein n=1 Tax=unclassified Streptomyces TaxID=2593676 RepID=UPI00225619A6|nr:MULTISPECIES: hypothetical protein [unclassified Streptomyces]MCX5107244.1 hypothetical protein [Streptomyces sp. NBC_00378]
MIGSLHLRHRTEEYKKFLIKLDKEVPAGLGVHLGSSWLNLVERWLVELTSKQIRRGVHRSVQALKKDIRNGIAA